MVIEKIEKKLTKNYIKTKINEIKKTKISQTLDYWIKEYEKIGERKYFIWQWLTVVFKIAKIPILPQEYEEKIREIKILLTMFIVLVDDAGEKIKNKNLFSRICTIPFSEKPPSKFNTTKEDQIYFNKVANLWMKIECDIRKLPKFEEYKEIFYYDLRQAINAMEYSYLANSNPDIINETEIWHFVPYNMNIFSYSCLDLMCTKRVSNLGNLRTIMYEMQRMTRIGNWLSTWEREVYENDYANGIIASAIKLKIVRTDDLKKNRREFIINSIKKSKIEKNILFEWEKSYKKLRNMKKEVKCLNILLKNLEEVLLLHLISKGYK